MLSSQNRERHILGPRLEGHKNRFEGDLETWMVVVTLSFRGTLEVRQYMQLVPEMTSSPVRFDEPNLGDCGGYLRVEDQITGNWR